MKQETTIFNADYCFSSWKGHRVCKNQARSCAHEQLCSDMFFRVNILQVEKDNNICMRFQRG